EKQEPVPGHPGEHLSFGDAGTSKPRRPPPPRAAGRSEGGREEGNERDPAAGRARRPARARGPGPTRGLRPGPGLGPEPGPGRGVVAGRRSRHLPAPRSPGGSEGNVGGRAPKSPQGRQGTGRAGPPTPGARRAPAPRANPPAAPQAQNGQPELQPDLGADGRTRGGLSAWGAAAQLSPQPTGRARGAATSTHLPASPPRNGGATLRPGPHRPPQPTPQAAVAVAAAAAAGREGRDGGLRRPRHHGPTRLRPPPDPAPGPPPPPLIGPRLARLGAAPPHHPGAVPLGFRSAIGRMARGANAAGRNAASPKDAIGWISPTPGL
ncbi:PREDICTED: basic proline-rich protein-like, partial [Dipodomys ordii]|uniref:Basic proline-rich protein-like n=1 Tax=Dipodomys ordii TaxID=10020 RepID=A0A1S3GWL0_DIPOR